MTTISSRLTGERNTKWWELRCSSICSALKDVGYDILKCKYQIGNYIPGTCLKPLFWWVEPFKTRSKFQSKEGSFGFFLAYIDIYVCCANQ